MPWEKFARLSMNKAPIVFKIVLLNTTANTNNFMSAALFLTQSSSNLGGNCEKATCILVVSFNIFFCARYV